MNWKTWSLLLLALAAGCVASFGVKTAFFVEKDAQAEATSDDFAPKERLLVANGALGAGTELNAQNVRFVLTPERDAPRDGIFTFEGITGRKVIRDLKDGEAISLYDLESSEETQTEDVSFVPPGCVVVPIEICSATKAVGGANYLKTTKLNNIVKPGDVVDLFVVKEDGSSRERRRLISEPVVENASVYAVSDENRRTADGLTRSSVLSALLSKEQVESVRQASEEGKIKVVCHTTDGLSYGESQEESDFLDDGLYSSIKNNDAILGRRSDDVSERSYQALDAASVENDAAGSLLDQEVASSVSSKDGEGVFMNVSRKIRVDVANDESLKEKDELLFDPQDDVLSDAETLNGDETFENKERMSIDSFSADDAFPADGGLPADGALPADGGLTVDGALTADGALTVDDALPADGGHTVGDAALPADGAFPVDGASATFSELEPSLAESAQARRDFFVEGTGDESKSIEDVDNVGAPNVADLIDLDNNKGAKDVKERPKIYSPYTTRETNFLRRRF